MTPAPRVVVFGYHDMGVLGLRVLLAQGARVAAVVTHPDDPGEPIWFQSLADAAARAGIPVLRPASPRDPGLLEAVRALAPDLLFSFYYRRLLPAPLLEIPRLGAVNLHGSLLPRYRGRAPLNWVLVNGETETGVTLHYMDEAADHGDIIAQRAVPITAEDTAATLWAKLLAAAEALLAGAYPAIAAGCAPRRPQDHAAATVVGRRRPADGRIDWTRPARDIHNLVRAVTHPFPGAFTFLGDRRILVWSARPAAGACGGPPGRVLGATPAGGVAVATGQGLLELLRLQPAGEAEMDGADFMARVLGGGAATFADAPRGATAGGQRT